MLNLVPVAAALIPVAAVINYSSISGSLFAISEFLVIFLQFVFFIYVVYFFSIFFISWFTVNNGNFVDLTY